MNGQQVHINSKTKQKQHSQMIRKYEDGIKQLYNNNLEQGSKILRQLLNQIREEKDSDLEQLKYTCLVSLGEVQRQIGNVTQSLQYMYQSACMKGQFIQWVKIANLCQSLAMYDQVQYSLKKALRKCPSLWRDKILEKLLETYKKNNKLEYYKDLKELMQTPEQLILRLNQDQLVQQVAVNGTQVELEQIQIQDSSTKQITISLYPSEQNWEYILSLLYIFLKVKSQRTFKTKKYFKKYQQTLNNTFLNQYQPSSTSILIKLCQSQPQIIKTSHINNMNTNNETNTNGNHKNDIANNISNGSIINNPSFSVKNLIQDFVSNYSRKKRKHKKQQQSKKLTQINNYKTNYPNFSEYLKQICNKYNLKLEELKQLSILSEEYFDKIIKPIIENQAVDEMNHETEKLSEDNNNNTLKNVQELNQRSIQSFKEFFTQNNNQSQFRYHNIYYMTQEIIKYFIIGNGSLYEPHMCLQNPLIKKLVLKCIIKLIQQTEGFLTTIFDSITMLELLVQKYEQISYKNYKSKQFRIYQLNKINQIYQIITKYYEPKIILFTNNDQQLLSTTLSRLSLALIRFYTVHNNISEVSYNKLISIFNNHYQKISHLQISLFWLQKGFTNDISNQIELRFKKAQLKIKSNTNQSDQKQTTSNVEQLFTNQNQDQQTIMHINEIKNKLLTSMITLPDYVIDLIEFTKMYFSIIIKNNKPQFNSRIIGMLSECVKFQVILKDLLEKIKTNNDFIFDIDKNKIIELIFWLLKLYIIQAFQDVIPLFRIIIYFTNQMITKLISNINDRKKTLRTIIKIYDKLAQMKKNKIEIYQQLRKRFYNILLSKNIYLILEDLNGDQQIFDIFESIYYDKQKQFNPRKIQDAIGFFVFINKVHRTTFQCREIDLQAVVNKLFRKCYKLYAEKHHQLYPFCEKFNLIQETFYCGIKGQNQLIIQIYNGNKICECCNFGQKDKCILNVLFILGKYFESQYSNEAKKVQKNKQQKNKEKDKTQEGQIEKQKDSSSYFESQQNLAEKFYTQLLLLDIKSVNNWKNLVRINCEKTYRYFDSLTLQNNQKQMPKYTNDQFLRTKILLLFISRNLGKRFQDICHPLNIINLLKLYERKLNMYLTELKEEYQEISQESQKLQIISNKYKQGLQKILQSFTTNQLKFKYLRLVQLRIPLLILTYLDSKDIKSMTYQFLLEFLKEIQLLIGQYQSILTETIASEQSDNVKHLYEDLIVQFYVFIIKVIYKISNSIFSNNTNDYLDSVRKIQILSNLSQKILNKKFQQPLASNYQFKIFPNQQNIEQQPKYNFYTNYVSKYLKAQQFQNIQKLISPINILFSQIVKLFNKIPSNQTKRYKFRRSVTTSVLWVSKIHLYFNSNVQQASNTIKEYFSSKTDDIVYVYHHYERQSTQKNQQLSQFYDRSIVYGIRRAEFIEHLFRIFEKDIENLILILKKLLKTSSNYSNVAKIQNALFLEGLGVILKSLKQMSLNGRLQEKYEKIILQWRNKIKKTLVNGQKMSLVENLQKFIQEYENKYGIKIRLKKKKTEQNLNNPNNEKLQENEIIHQKQEQKKRSLLISREDDKMIDESKKQRSFISIQQSNDNAENANENQSKEKQQQQDQQQ